MCIHVFCIHTKICSSSIFFHILQADIKLNMAWNEECKKIFFPYAKPRTLQNRHKRYRILNTHSIDKLTSDTMAFYIKLTLCLKCDSKNEKLKQKCLQLTFEARICDILQNGHPRFQNFFLMTDPYAKQKLFSFA